MEKKESVAMTKSEPDLLSLTRWRKGVVYQAAPGMSETGMDDE